MADYTDSATVKATLGGVRTWNTEDDALLAEWITVFSRRFDTETGRQPNFWAAHTGITRAYSGRMDTTLAIDPFTAITSVSMSQTRDRSGAVTMNFVDPNDYYYVQTVPRDDPPFTALSYLYGWWEDIYGIGNILVTGDTVLPVEVGWAVTQWLIHAWRGKESGYADGVVNPEGSPAFYTRAIPADVKRVIDQYAALAATTATGASSSGYWIV